MFKLKFEQDKYMNIDNTHHSWFPGDLLIAIHGIMESR